ncbi:isochorismatase [Cohnella sp. CIP 111063]|uniref:cysteine hydrolase family protein n=1 Tax=unclassified Cohnella TaxID=2636738 RepID=UPI000B8C2ED4|nr:MULTISPECIES: isochorismatase family cysteine hydrolase [unclassified Cohnella]OXS53035.1 isochorismatase [Cohnella sp. CIP 111063]PRX60540.1 nicotinamidase-related amidase [Cohnella sp. SGD-V74]
MKALIVIDYTVDFVVGKLPVGEPGIAIEDRVCEIARRFAEQGDWVVMAVDLHEEGDAFHPETKLFPPHNIRGTDGRKLYGKLDEWYAEAGDSVYWMDKTRYSAFCGTDLELKLRERDVREVHLVGVCTDICVLHTAVDAYNKGFRTVVHADAVASFNPQGHEWALGHFEGVLGAEVVRDYR